MKKSTYPFGGKGRRDPFAPPKTEKPTKRRRYDFERMLGEAVNDRVLVDLTYDDFVSRSFQPTVVYRSTKDHNKILVGGIQITNPLKPQDNLEPHVFEVGSITVLSISKRAFVVEPQFDRFDKRYAAGILYSV